MPIKQTVFEQLKMTEEELVEHLSSDMSEIFYKMAGIENVAKNPKIIDPINVFNDSVTALVGLAGALRGLVSLHLPDILAKEFTSKMRDSPVTAINRDVHDAIGELALIIAGAFKYRLANHGENIHLSIPSTFTAGEYYFSSSDLYESLAILCDVGDQWFMVCLTIKNSD